MVCRATPVAPRTTPCLAIFRFRVAIGTLGTVSMAGPCPQAAASRSRPTARGISSMRRTGNYYVALDRVGNSTSSRTWPLASGAIRSASGTALRPMQSNTNGVTYGITGLGGATATVGTGGATRGQLDAARLDLMVTVAGNYQVYVGATGKSNDQRCLRGQHRARPRCRCQQRGWSCLAVSAHLAGFGRRRKA